MDEGLDGSVRSYGSAAPSANGSDTDPSVTAKTLQRRLYVKPGTRVVPRPPVASAPTSRRSSNSSLASSRAGSRAGSRLGSLGGYSKQRRTLSLHRDEATGHVTTSILSGYALPPNTPLSASLGARRPASREAKLRPLHNTTGAHTLTQIEALPRAPVLPGLSGSQEPDLEDGRAAVKAPDSDEDGSSSGGEFDEIAENEPDPDAHVDKSDPLWFIQKLNREPDTLEFKYLTPKNKGSPHFNPYDLLIVPHAEIDEDDYYTLSSKGLTHFINGSAEFVPLEQWVREYHLYRGIKDIPMFAQYRMWKAYTVWRASSRSRKSAICRQTLESNLFVANDVLGHYLRRVRSMCYDLGAKPLFDIQAGVTYTLDEFLAAQTKHKDVIRTRLEDFTAAVKATVAEACEAALSQAGFDDEMGGLDDARAAGGLNTPGFGGGAGVGGVGGTLTVGGGGRGREFAGGVGGGMAGGASAGNNQVSFTFLAAKRTECRRLANFIKLADYLIINTVHQLAVRSVELILDAVTPPADTEFDADGLIVPKNVLTEEVERDVEADLERQALAAALGDLEEAQPEAVPLFVIELKLSDNKLDFSPDAKVLEDRLAGHRGLIKDFERLILDKVEKLITNEEFLTRYVSPTLNERLEVSEVGEGPVLLDILEMDTDYTHLVSQIKDALTTAFLNAKSYARVFEPYWTIYMENQLMDIRALERNEPELAYFRAQMRKFRQQMAEMESIPIRSDVGIVAIDSKQLKATFLPSPKRCLSEIEALLPRLGKARLTRLLEQLESATANLTETPTSVQAFVEKLRFLDSLNDELDTLQAEYELVRAMHALINEYSKNVEDPELDAQYANLPSKMDAMKTQMSIFEGSKETDIGTFSHMLAKDIDGLQARIREVRRAANTDDILTDTDDIGGKIRKIDGLRARVAELKEATSEAQLYQNVFKLPTTEFQELDVTIGDLNDKHLLWKSLSDFDATTAAWRETPFNELNATQMTDTVNQYSKVCQRLERNLLPNPVLPRLKEKVDDFATFLPIVVNLRNDCLKLRHWEAIYDATGERFGREKTMTLGAILEKDMIEHKDAIEEISNHATQEKNLEDMLKRVEDTWESAEFVVEPYKETKDQFFLKATDDLLTLLEESSITVSTILGSRYVEPIRKSVVPLAEQLELIKETLTAWLQCQVAWMSLEPIFTSPDIISQLPDQDKLFKGVDRMWRDIMRRTKDKPNVRRICSSTELLEKFNHMNEMLDKVQQSVDIYLEQKRNRFPRFYFLSDEELLKILSQSREPLAVQPHLRKCFDNIQALEFTEERSTDIIAMISADGERVPFVRTVKPRDAVEKWLGKVEDEMRNTLARRMEDCFNDHDTKTRQQWVFDHAAQLVLAISQVMWVRDVEAALSSPNPNNSLIQLRNKCKRMVGDLAILVRGDLEKLQRGVVSALMTLDVHNREVVRSLQADKIADVTDFEWAKQLRHYWRDDDYAAASGGGRLILEQTNASFAYGYEYLGCSPRLVITPLTDRCYITLTGAMHLQLGGAPAGPAGTGKTETVKDLSKAMAIQCVVFNCSENLDVTIMGQFFSGLISAGAWACFDEFNRIDIEVLSVIATQLLNIRNAKVQDVDEFEFEARTLRLNPNCAYFITMNPGYRGRTELPDNLKALFRPIAMMIPNYGMIAEIMLLSEGFESAKRLSVKMRQLYKLASEQLSQQKHYDFGLRAVKSVLVMAGSLKRSNEDLPEDIVLIRALRDSNLPKFLAEDISLFQNIINDLFPGIELPDQDYGVLQGAIEETLKAKGLQIVETQVNKIIQLYETTVRHGLMLIGPTGGGKTTAYRTLQDALSSLRANFPDIEEPTFQTVETKVLNPKSISMNELYGWVDKHTKEYTPGVITHIVQECVEDTTDTLMWVVFDGPVDATWIENMNTVLDDNKMLCLPNSARIRLTPRMRMMFEVSDLAKASPATVSRCGMVYMEPSHIGWECYVQTWLEGRVYPEFVKERLLMLFERFVNPGLRFIRAECTEDVPSTDLSAVSSLCAFLETFLNEARGMDFSLPEEEVNKTLEDLFLFSYIWSIGGNLDKDSREVFDPFVQDLFKDLTAIPGLRSCYNYYVDMHHRQFRPWEDITPEFKYDPAIPYFNMLVPTVETVSYQYMLDALLAVARPVMLTGMTGVGKSVIIQDHLRTASSDGSFVSVTVNMSAQTTSARLQEQIESNLEKKNDRAILGGPKGKPVTLFVDDINMPKPDESGSQPPIELLRQFMDFNGFYDRPLLFWKTILDLNVVAACAPPGGGRNVITQRLTRHFCQMCIPPTPTETLEHIFGQILEGFLSEFPTDVASHASRLTTASVEVYNRISVECRPTPAKSHYTFNLRDLSRVVQGVLQARLGFVNSAEDLARLWAHENMRVFHDRLVNTADRTYFTELLTELVRRHLNMTWDHDEVFVRKPPIFGDFMRIGAIGSERVYREITDEARLMRVLEEYLDRFNMSHDEMQLVLFKDAVMHIARICRIVQQPRGNALLVGVGGTGKRSLTRLAAHMCEFETFEITLTRNYGAAEFKDDLRSMYHQAGIEGRSVVFLLSDTQITDESFLEDVGNILNSGEVPSLFEHDDYEKVIMEARQKALDAGLPNDRGVIYRHFISTVRENLHIVLCMSPVGSAFRNRCRQFPSLVNCCTINWFDEWPEDALESVARVRIGRIDLESEETKALLPQLCVSVHTSVSRSAERFFAELRRRFYITPTSYLEFLSLYKSVIKIQRFKLAEARARYETGINKLNETSTSIATMEKTLVALQPELQQKAATTEQLMRQVTEETEDADAMRKVVSAEEAEVNEATLETKIAFEEAERDLREVMPELNRVMAELAQTLDARSVAEVKQYTQPPKKVKRCMEAVLILLGDSLHPTWELAKQVLGDAGFLKRLETFDRNNVSEQTLVALKKYLDDPEFTPEAMMSSSVAIASLVAWVQAINLYSRVYRDVAPKRVKRDEAQARLREMTAKLAEKQAALQEVEDKINALQAQYEATVAAKMELQNNIERTAKRLERAAKLTESLSDEAVRWKEEVSKIDLRMVTVEGDMFLAAACVAYHGAFTSSYRRELVDKWYAEIREAGVPVSDNFSLVNQLGEAVTLRSWQLQGLPNDLFSSQNGILVDSGLRWPLMIDPQGQANTWVKNMERKNNLVVIKLTDKDYLRQLERAVRSASPCLLENVGEELDPALDPLLKMPSKQGGGRQVLKLGEAEFDYDPAFRFYITTKLANPHYLPDVCIKVTIINFTVTLDGLDDQLLGRVVSKEMPDLEAQRVDLIVSLADDKKQLQDIEDQILKLLYETDIEEMLDDENLINTLGFSKTQSIQIKERVRESEFTEQQVNEARNRYRPVSVRGSILYFVLADLALVDPMYEYSLEYFITLFNGVLDTAAKSNDQAARIRTLLDASTLSVYENVSRGLFAKHKILFSFLIGVKISLNDGRVSENELNFLLRGGAVTDRAMQEPRPENAPWITPKMWDLVCELATTSKAFEGFPALVESGIDEWMEFYESADPVHTSLPAAWEGKLSAFQRILVLRTFRPEKVAAAATEYVVQTLGRQFKESKPFSLADIHAGSNPAMPIIFVLSTGADPRAGLVRFAEEMNMTDRLVMQSLGQRQGEKAEANIREGLTHGRWVYLQNCHLAKSWMPELERLVKEVASRIDDVHPDFRLWLSSKPTRDFPVTVLQNGYKITDEPPKGVRANMVRSFGDISAEEFDDCGQQTPWRRLQYGLIFFHALVQERKKFGPLGWNIKYEFNSSDLLVSRKMLQNFLDEGEEIPFKAIRYMIGEIAYGGRVTDDWDRVCLKTTLDMFFNSPALATGHSFSPSGAYTMPPDGGIDAYRSVVEAFPDDDPPEVFGLHTNANITYEQRESSKMIDIILQIQPRKVTGDSTVSNDDVVKQLASKLLEEVPEDLNISEAEVSLFEPDANGRLNSLTTVLTQESARFNILLGVIRKSLSDIQRAIVGEVVMSEPLEKMFTSLLNNHVPAVWEEVSYLSLKKLDSWFPDLKARVSFLRGWINNGQPSCFWMSGLFYPQGFLTGVLQNHARKHGVAVDGLAFKFSVLEHDFDEIDSPPEDGVYINGLYLDGAAWDWAEGHLIEAEVKELYCPLPVIHLEPCDGYERPANTYECPLYKTSERAGVLSTTGQSTNFIIGVDLPTKHSPDHWVLRGTAMLTQLDE